MRQVLAESAGARLLHALADFVNAPLNFARLFVFLGRRFAVAQEAPALRKVVECATQEVGFEGLVESAGPQNIGQHLFWVLERAAPALRLEPRRGQNLTVELVQVILNAFGRCRSAL